jgi:hypothetical protein
MRTTTTTLKADDVDTVIGVLGWVIVIWSFVAWRRRRKHARRLRPPRPINDHGRSSRTSADTIGGWLLGHQIAAGHHGMPGDPLPGGHLGSPANLAFWGGVLDDDEEADADTDYED